MYIKVGEGLEIGQKYVIKCEVCICSDYLFMHQLYLKGNLKVFKFAFDDAIWLLTY